MRHIGTHKNERLAKRFADHLFAQEISGIVDPEEDGSWSIWVHDEEDVERVREEYDLYLIDPEDPRYLETERRSEHRPPPAKSTKETFDLARLWREHSPVEYPLTIALILVSVLVSAAAIEGPNAAAVKERMYIARPLPPDGEASLEQTLAAGEIWRLVTPIFLHENWLYLAFNMYWLFWFGKNIETARGTWRLLLLMVVFAVPTNYLEYRLGRSPETHYEFHGMSPVIFAMFAYSWMKSFYDPALGIRVPGSTVAILMVWFLIAVTPLVPDVPRVAQFFGLSIGTFVGYLPTLWKKRQQKAKGLEVESRESSDAS